MILFILLYFFIEEAYKLQNLTNLKLLNCSVSEESVALPLSVSSRSK